MAGNISISTGVETPAQSRTSVSGGFSLPARPAPAPQAPAGYQLVYQMGGPRYMYGETPRYGAYYSDGGIVPGQIYGNMRGSREGADMFGFWPTMFQSQPYATASQMYTPSLGVMPLIGYPSKYPHVIMGGYSDYGAPIANQAISMMLPLLMMGLYRQMFPMMPQAPAQAAKPGGGSGGGKSGGGSSGDGSSRKISYDYLLPLTEEAKRVGHYQNLEEALAQPDSGRVEDYQGFDPDYAMRSVSRQATSSASAVPQSAPWRRGLNVANWLLNPAGAAGAAVTPYAETAGRWALDHPVERRVVETVVPGIGPATAATDATWSALSDYVRGK